MKKYKFILTLDEYTRVDSAEEIEGHVSWPNYSQADPVRYRGVFDTYEEAKEYASNFSLYNTLQTMVTILLTMSTIRTSFLYMMQKMPYVHSWA